MNLLKKTLLSILIFSISITQTVQATEVGSFNNETVSETDNEIVASEPEKVAEEADVNFDIVDENMSEQTPENNNEDISENISENTNENITQDTGEVGIEETISTYADIDIYEYIYNNMPAGEYIFAEGQMIGEKDSIQLLKDKIGELSDASFPAEWNGNTLTKLSVNNMEVITLLSNTDPVIYKDALIEKSTSFTGTPSIRDVRWNENILMSFKGLGSSLVPFTGNLQMNSFYLSEPLFNNIDLTSAQIKDNTIELIWSTNENKCASFANILTAGGSTLTVIYKTDSENKFNTFTAPIINKLTGDLSLTIQPESKAFKNVVEDLLSTEMNNLGSVVNDANGNLTIEFNGMFSSIDIFSGQTGTAVQKGNTGGLVGYATGNLTINGTLNMPQSNIQAQFGSAGSIAGMMNSDSLITLTINDADLSNANPVAIATGGVVGQAINTTINVETQLILPTKVGGIDVIKLANGGTFNTSDAGGLFGWFSQTVSGLDTIDENSKIIFNEMTIEGTGNIGGYFARATLYDKMTFHNVEANIIARTSGTLGGLIGNITNRKELYVRNVNVKAVANSTPLFFGGIVGDNMAYSEVSDVSILTPHPRASKSFGGVYARTYGNTKLNNITLTTFNDEYPYVNNLNYSNEVARRIGLGGGLIGQVMNSVIEISGITDMTNVGYSVQSYGRSVSLGQLIGENNGGLIYALGDGNGNGWTFNRSTYNYRVDDIGNYGEVIRLGGNISSDLISLSKDGVSFKSGTIGEISSNDDLVLLALANQTHGLFNILGVTEMADITVNLNTDVNLKGTGINSLTRDITDTSYNFGTGSFAINGNNHTIEFESGSTYGLRNGSAATGDGSGQIYRHSEYGLINNAGSVVLNNLTINGNIYFGADLKGDAGIVMAKLDKDSLYATNVNVLGTVEFDGTQVMNTGGFAGYILLNTNKEANFYNVNVGPSINYKGLPEVNATHNNSNTSLSSSLTDNIVLGGFAGVMNGAGYSKIAHSVVNANITSASAKSSAFISILTNLKDASIWNLTVNGALNVNGSHTGGTLGYFWNRANINMNNGNWDKLTQEDKDAYALTNSLTINCSGDVGGLVYGTGAIFNLGKAIDSSNAKIIGASTVGLIAIHGEPQNSTAGSYSSSGNAIYLKFLENWNTAYLINPNIIEGSPSEFDEFVLYTTQNNIMQNNAGIISLKTTSLETYENRTVYGQGKMNNRSRYYYNLDTLTLNGDIDTGEELLLWSLNKYACKNVRDAIGVVNTNVIGGSTLKTIDLTNISYYPVSVSGATFKNVEIVFDSHDMVLSSSDLSQHYLMHSGLIYDLSGTLSMQNVSLDGPLTKHNERSGAIIVGKTRGSSESDTSAINIKNLTIKDNLSVRTYTDGLNPLLINEMQRFSRLVMDGVVANNAPTGSSSLIGRVGTKIGNETVEGIILDFSKIVIPDTTRFSHATLLESFYFNQASSGAYNFSKEEDWDGSNHIKQLTYGREIGGTVQYQDSLSNPAQRKYLLSSDNVSYSGNFAGEDDFSNYLPYVYVGYDGNGMNELKINYALVDVDDGCGTYSDPYLIKDETSLVSIANFIATGEATLNWTVNIANEEPCINHSTYVYQGNGFFSNGTDTISVAAMREHIVSAYYSIETDLNLNDFTGLGTGEYPFRGVIIGKNNKITYNGNSRFINTSYGSVVKDLILDYSATDISLSYEEIEKDYTSRSYFGGVIGAIMGGDNIIDNVSVVLGDITVNSYLIPVGTYVGVISGGGVIFRNTSNNTFVFNTNILSTDERYLYVNNLVGRVLNGFAFNEGANVLNNTDKNYKIANISGGDSLEMSGNTILIKNAQGLAIYQAMLSSGSLSYGKTKPYSEGKTRKAMYNEIGTSSLTDYELAKLDDASDMSVPYLNYKYANGMTAINGSVNYELVNGTYDMTNYFYQGIGPRYLSNAVISNNGKVELNVINPITESFDGNGSTIIVDTIVKNYVKDDHFAVGVGGIFNTLNPVDNTTIRDVSVAGNIKLKYYSVSTKLVDDTFTNFPTSSVAFTNLRLYQGRYSVAVGGIVGNLPTSSGQYVNSDVSNRIKVNVNFDNVKVKDAEITSPWSAGGFVGLSGYRYCNQTSDNYTVALLLGGYNSKYLITGYTFTNSSFDNIKVYGGFNSGGFIGYIGDGGSTSVTGNHFGNLLGSETAYGLKIYSNSVIGENSEIATMREKTDSGIDGDKNITISTTLSRAQCLPAAGGVSGWTGLPITMEGDMTMYNVSVKSGRSAGGVSGWASQSFNINGLTIEGARNGDNYLTRIGDLYPDVAISGINRIRNYEAEFAGGIIGYRESPGQVVNISNTTISNMYIIGTKGGSYPCYASSLIGHFYNRSAKNNFFKNIAVKDNYLVATSTAENNSNGRIGGLFASLRNNSGNNYMENILIENNAMIKNNGSYYGLISGDASGGSVKVYGLSVQNTKDLKIPNTLLGTGSSTNVVQYATFTDYNGVQDATMASLVGGTTQSKPFVNTSPIGKTLVLDGETVSLYGDASDPNNVIDIYNKSINKTGLNKYYYNTYPVSLNNLSTYLTEMERTVDETDFNVLKLPVAETEETTATIVNYLNMATNGGFSAVAEKNRTNLYNNISITLYKETDNGFEKQTGSTPLTFNKSTGQFSTSYDWDNGKNQFELLTVRFNEEYQGKTITHELNIPIIVRRVLEVEFSATFKEGATFIEDLFKTNASHLTIGFNENATALITYRYNTEENYGFRSMAENGGKLGVINKQLVFSNPNSNFKSLPNGTQLVLIDSNEKAYSLILEGQDGINNTVINMSDFKDSAGNNYEEKWISEVMDFELSSDANGKWVETEEADATIKIDGKYFRLKTKTDKGETFSIKFNETVSEEKFYLVLFIPNESLEEIKNHNGENQKNDLNGFIGTNIELGLTYNLSYKLINGLTDTRQNTPSTYSILSGYLQELTDLSNTDEFDIYEIFTGGLDKYINVDILDKIHVSEGQAFESTTPMYYKLDISLPYYEKMQNSDNVVLSASNGFPLGCYGVAEFYVYTTDGTDKTYYTYENGHWNSVPNETIAFSQNWDSNGSNMELLLGDGVSLTELRTKVMQTANASLNHDIYIRAKMKLYMSTKAVELVIAGATAEGNAYTKLNYTGTISNTIDGFVSSNYSVNKLGTIRYWQSIAGLSEISLSANNPSQLGINCNSLSQADGTIYLTGIYDLSKMSSPEKLLDKADYVRFEISLYEKQQGGNYSLVADPENYLSEVKIGSSNGWTYDITKEWSYFENNKFSVPIKVKVNTDIETRDQFYANYRIVLRAYMVGGNETINVPKQEYDYITYTLARINTDGVWD